MRAPSRRAEIRAGGRQPCNAGGRSGYLRFAPNAPTYVPVFDAQTSEPAALNLEARRMVEALGLPGSSGADVRPKRS